MGWFFFSASLPGQDGRLLRFFVFFSGLKQARRLLQVILLPEGQAVELLQGHAEDLLEVLGR